MRVCFDFHPQDPEAPASRAPGRIAAVTAPGTRIGVANEHDR